MLINDNPSRRECERLCSATPKSPVMDLNVCSRRVHDGYATIRSRGRSRPRAVYRSDSEELLKEAVGPYALPRLSNFPVASNDLHQVPRWSDFSKDCLLIENYGTLRDVKKANLLEDRKQVTLNTFSKVDQGRSSLPNGCVQPINDVRVNGQGPLNTFPSRNGGDERKRELCRQNAADENSVYDTVPVEEYPPNGRTTLHSFRPSNSRFEGKDQVDGSVRVPNSSRDVVIVEPSSRKLQEMEVPANQGQVQIVEKRNLNASESDTKARKVAVVDCRKITNAKDKQPIYAVPNSLSKSRRDRRVILADGNYVPSGDLYRTTAKYIEDINRNIAEIDKSYEELKSNSNNSAYGVINKIAKGELPDRCNFYGYARKRDMAPMPPISSDFCENLDEKMEKQPDVTDKIETLKSISVPRSRPNSFRKIPPKLLPRSSSIDNTSRHSTGSTTTSSTKSTESLYAISESLSSEVQENTASKMSLLSNVSKNSLSSKQDPSTEGSDELESKDEMSSTDDDRPPAVRSVDRLSVTSTIRKNRARVDADKSYLKRDRTSPASKYDICQPNSITDRRNQINSGSEANCLDDSYLKRRYDTLPYRRSRVASRPLHKSSEDVLDGERPVRHRSSSLSRPCTSNIDISVENDESLENYRNAKVFDSTKHLPLYLMDATDIILRGHLDRTSRSFQRQNHFKRTAYGRTRHNSLESEPEDKGEDDNCRYSGFATLPRRGNLSKDQPPNDPLRRLSGNVPVLEPLYEHAVSDPVKPRSTEIVIPWWELATRKYRHRSCPSLQVTQRTILFVAVKPTV